MKKPDDDLDRAFARVRRAAKAAKLPEIEPGTSYGTPALKLRGKFLMRVKDADTLVFMCPLEEKEMLMAAEPRIYFETDHYKGWPAILVRPSAADDAELHHCLTRAWRLQAPKKLQASLAGQAAAGAAKPPKRKSHARQSRKRSKPVR